MTQYTKVTEKINTSLFKSINEENIEVLVREFYSRVYQDSYLQTFFIEKLGDDFQGEKWEKHLLLLSDFWRFVALGYNDYDANPLQPHFEVKNLSVEAFTNWLKLFHATVDSLYEPSIGLYFKDKSNDIAKNFIRKLNL